MTLAGDTRVRFSELDQQELVEYRPLNRPAVVACILGWLASAALIHPILCLLPLLGIMTALIALRQLSSAENKQSGRRLALIGLCLSVLFGSWTVAREASRELRLYGHARQFAEDWFARIRDGQFYEAHQLTLMEGERAAPGVSLKDHYAPRDRPDPEKMRGAGESGTHAEPAAAMLEMMAPPPHDTFEMYFGTSIGKRLRDMGSKAQYEFQENRQILVSGVNSLRVELVFVASEESDGRLKSFPIKITLERDSYSGLNANWRVVEVTDSFST